MQRSLSFENLGNGQPQNSKQPEPQLWDEEFLNYQTDMDTAPLQNASKIVTFSAFAFESTSDLKFEKRLGADLGPFVFKKNLEKCCLTTSQNDFKFVSFLEFYEIHPLKLINKKSGNMKDFYLNQYFENMKNHLKGLGSPKKLLNVLLLGNFGGLEGQVSRYLGSFENLQPEKTVVLMFSPLQRNTFVSEFKEILGCKFIYFGLDKKFYKKESERPEDEKAFRDIQNGVKTELEILERVARNVEGGQIENVFIVWDCEVFASDTFPGLEFFSNSQFL